MRPRDLMALALGAGVVAACEFDEVTVPSGSARPVVHVVMNPYTRQSVIVLVERTLGGRVRSTEGEYDPENPIVSGGGEPITGARVTIEDLTGGTFGTGVELARTRTDGKFLGVYAVPTPCQGCLIVARGYSYRLRIEIPDGPVVIGTVTVPQVLSRPDTGLRRVFNAVTDTYVFSWPAAEPPRRYALQVQTPFGPFQTFSAVESLAVAGKLRNFQAERFPRVFVPGFVQALQAFAVDQNYFDYYRSENDPFTGLGLIDRLENATGVFGAVIPIRYQDIDVVARFDEPVDGVWQLEDTPDPDFPVRLTTWADGAFASGRHQDVYDTGAQPRRAMLGTRSGNRLRLAVLDFQNPRDTAWTLDGTVAGDLFVTTSPTRGEQRWRRRPELQ